MEAEVNGTRMHYTVEGDGPPVVLLHGYQLDRTYWGPQVRALQERYRVIVPDLRGFGSTPLGNVEINTGEQMADDVNALLDRIGVTEPIVLCGLSMGGYVALAFMERYAARVRALVMADSRASGDTEEGRQARLRIAEQVEREQDTRAAREALYPNLMAPAGYEDPELVAHVQAMGAKPSVAAIAATLRAMAARPNRRSLLPQIACPTLAIVGELDRLTPPSEAEVIRDGVPGAELVVIPKVGHLSNLEAPEAFNQALLDFLERHIR